MSVCVSVSHLPVLAPRSDTPVRGAPYTSSGTSVGSLRGLGCRRPQGSPKTAEWCSVREDPSVQQVGVDHREANQRTRPTGCVHRRSQALRGSSPPPSVRTFGPVGPEDGRALVSRDSYTEMAVLRVRLAAPRFTGIKDAPHGSTGVTAIRCLRSDNLCDNDSHVVLVPCTPLASRANDP